MRLAKPVRENLVFLIAETRAQAGNLRVRLETGSQSAAQRLLDRRGYAYNLKMRIHNGSIAVLQDEDNLSARDVFGLRAAEAIASELEWMTDLFHDSARQPRDLDGKVDFPAIVKSGMLDHLETGLDLMRQSLFEEDSKSAIRLAEIGTDLQSQHERFYQLHLKKLKQVKRQEKVVVAILIAERLKECGQILLDISEALISARFGQRMHLNRFRSLESAIEELAPVEPSVRGLAETKSGSAISAIDDKDSDQTLAVFKDGQKRKLREERQSVEAWHDIFPGLAPKILSWRKRGDNASLLIEHLPGLTLEQILLNESDALLRSSLKSLGKTLKAVWKETLRKEKVLPGHMAQLQKRLPAVTSLHPDFNRPGHRIGGWRSLSLEQMIEKAAEIEAGLPSPFAVYIHGDFNLDNIICDPDSNRINFIDLHRSCYADYSQDVSVFMVSNYRLQVMDAKTRARLRMAACAMEDFAHQFASKHGDTGFSARLAFGLARSFITSTRFILDRRLATDMMQRGVYILEHLLDHHDRHGKEGMHHIQLPIKALF